ncbi:Putative FtsK/SpoIIIE family protein [Mycobacteroides abscessus subsp. massiliense]|nr:Putative FtsK/SpoIIIE family protein [Mycobacteroides abscessus subsp. massiliense]
MSTIDYVRPKDKELAPTVHKEEVQLKPPPQTPRPVPSGLLAKAAPILVVVGVIGIMVFMFKARTSQMNGFAMTMFPMFMMTGVVMMFMRGGGKGKQKNETAKDTIDYLRYLDGHRDLSIEAGENQYAAAQFHYPHAAGLAGWIVPKAKRLWERRMGMSEFAHARVGLGDEDAARRLLDVELGALEDQEPASVDTVQALLSEHSKVRDIPRPIALAAFPAVSCAGDLDVARANLRAIGVHLAFFHGYDDMEIAAIVDDAQAPQWDWLKWLPHHSGRRSRYMTYATAYDLVDDLGESFTERGFWSGRTMRLANLQSEAGDGAPSAAPATGRHLVVFCDSANIDWSTLLLEDKGRSGVSFVDVRGECPITGTDSTLLYEDGVVKISETVGGVPEYMAVPDQLSVTEAETFARRLAPYRVGQSGREVLDAVEDSSSSIDLMDLLGIEDAANFDPGVTWQWSHDRRNFLRVPVGRYIDSGRTWYIDFKEDEESHGPHTGTGGSTGAGKSEKLKTEAISLCATHSPEDVVITPCDFKGNKTFKGLERLPHVPMVLHNLSASRDRIARVLQVFMGEIERRYALLDLIGEDGTKIDDYRAIRKARPELNLPPMPHWFIPFDELMQAKREFPELLGIMRIVGTVGRSVGVHEEPVSQTLDDSLMTGISTHLRGRTAMKMNDAKDYKPILGTANVGAALPKRKGVGYFVEDFNGLPQRVESCFVSKIYEPPVITEDDHEEVVEIDYYRPRMLSAVPDPVARKIEGTYDDAPVPAAAGEDLAGGDSAHDGGAVAGGGSLADAAGDGGAEGADNAPGSGDGVELTRRERRTIMSTVIDVLEEYCRVHNIELPHQMWLPELDFYTPVSVYAEEYLAGLEDPNNPPTLVAPCGIIDKPRTHSQDVLEVDLSKNAAIAGGEDAGKSIAMMSIIMGAAYVYGPDRMQFYCIDQGGGKLGTLLDLDHVGDVVTGVDSYGVQRIINHLNHIITTRTTEWAAAGIRSIEEWRRLKFNPQPGDKPIPDDPNGDIYLFMDGFDQTIQDYAQHVDALISLASSGPNVGVHLVVSVRSWNSRGTHKFWPLIKANYEMRLGSTNDSNLTRAVAESIPMFPGRGAIAVSGGREARRDVMPVGGDSIPPPIAWHILFAEPAIQTASGNLVGEQACQFINARHGAEAAPGIPVLPAHVRLADVPEGAPGTLRVGLREADLGPQLWTPDRDGHLYVLGESGCGKTELARMIGRQLQKMIEDSPPDDRPLVIVCDQRRGLANVVPGADRYVYMPQQMPEAMALVMEELKGRNPDEVLTQEQIAAQMESGRGFDGRRVFFLVDEFTDWVENLANDPFRPLQKFADRGKDIGFHMVITRVADAGAWNATGGVLASMRTSGAPALAMSADPAIVNLIGKVRGQKFREGRGLLVSRTGQMMVQVAEDPGKL